MPSGFLTQLVRVLDRINYRFAVDAGNKITAGSSNLFRGTMKSLFDANLHKAGHPRNLYFNLQFFLKDRG